MFFFFLINRAKIYLTQPLNHFENSNRSLQFSWRFFKILLFFGMSCYPCENFQLFILYNFLFRHMVWKRFPTALNSYLIFMRKGENHEHQILGTKNSSGWVLTLVRTFRMKFQTFCHMIKNTISTLVEKTGCLRVFFLSGTHL